jgi:CubicO group peptidase (beta-lactamase class C family)
VRHAKLFCAAALLASTGCATVQAEPEVQAMRNPQMIEHLAACFDAQRAVAPFNGVVLVRTPEGDEFRRAVGYSDAAGRVPMTGDARFRVASVTKVITRAAIARLADEGRISLDAAIGTYVPGLPEPMAKVTVDQLIHHSSGIVNLTHLEDGDPDFDALMNAKRATDILPVLVKHPLEFAPGTKRVYSNGGFDMLGVVVEAVTGKTYAAHVEEAIFRPLGMHASSFVPEGRMAVPMTTWDMKDAARPQPAPHFDRVGRPSGSSIHTADDLLKLGRALMGDRFLSRSVKERTLEMDYGGVGQLGGTAGTSTAFMAFETGLNLIVLANYDPPMGELMAMALWGVTKGEPCRPKAPPPEPAG